jgi:AAA+ superfamily predicted ATPase
MQTAPAFHDAYLSNDDHLADWHALVLALHGRWLARYGHRLFDLDGNRHDVEVSLAEATALASGAPMPVEPEMLRAQGLHVQAIVSRIDGRLAQSCTAQAAPLAIEELRALFGLDDGELTALLVAAMPALSTEVARLTRFVTGRDDHLTTHGFVAEVCGNKIGVGPARLRALRPSGRLRRLGLVEVDGSGVSAALRVPTSILEYLQQEVDALPCDLVGACSYHEPSAALPVESLLLDEIASRRLERSLRPANAKLLVVGPAGVGRRTAARAWLAARGMGVLEVDLGHLLATGSPSLLIAAAREARLRRCALLVRTDGLPTPSAETKGALLDGLAAVAGRLIVTSVAGDPHVHKLLPGAARVEIQRQSASLQRRAWLAVTHCPDTGAELVRRFQLGVGIIHRVAASADAHTVPALTRAVRSSQRHELDALAQPMNTEVGWDDIVLAPDVEAKLREVVAHARHRELVFDEWGLGDKMTYGGGLSCLFSGPPGTGKTMMASVLARELGREVWRVDVSRLVSKWIGETEKNLARVFDEAARAQVVLLFDEADSLFAKRTQVRGANDRHANMEVNFLLQKMESHPGITVLTTNLFKGIDEAFLRRIRFKISFDAPNATSRALLWKRLLPPRAPLADDIDFEALGREFEMSGGHVRNAVMRAAFMAATGGGAIGHTELFEAGLAEAREMGRLVRA